MVEDESELLSEVEADEIGTLVDSLLTSLTMVEDESELLSEVEAEEIGTLVDSLLTSLSVLP